MTPMEELGMGRPRVSETQTSIRLPSTLTERAEKMAEILSHEEAFIASSPSGVPTSFILRMAIARGLDSLEAEYSKKRAKK